MNTIQPMDILTCPSEKVPELCLAFLSGLDDMILQAGDDSKPELEERLTAEYNELEVMYKSANKLKEIPLQLRNSIRLQMKHVQRLPVYFYNQVCHES